MRRDSSHGFLYGIVAAILMCGFVATLARADPPLHDPNLPGVTSGELQQLADDRLRQKIMLHSLAAYHGACSCPNQVRPGGGICRGHVHLLPGHRPLCYPREVTAEMLVAWRRAHG